MLTEKVRRGSSVTRPALTSDLQARANPAGTALPKRRPPRGRWSHFCHATVTSDIESERRFWYPDWAGNRKITRGSRPACEESLHDLGPFRPSRFRARVGRRRCPDRLVSRASPMALAGGRRRL